MSALLIHLFFRNHQQNVAPSMHEDFSHGQPGKEVTARPAASKGQ
jgi:hypothetical protein